MIDPEILDFISYNPETGEFHWKKDRGKKKAGSIAGSPSKQGYLEIRFKGIPHYGHILAWFITYGYEPKMIDHRNRIQSDTRLKNLRETCVSDNNKNRPMNKNNATGFKGVAPCRDRYRAHITINKKQLHLGIFDHPKDAAIAYDKAALDHFGEYAATNQMLGLL